MLESTPAPGDKSGAAQAHLQAERRGLARGGVLSFIGAASSAALGFLLILVASRLMGEHGAGVLIQLIGIFSITSVVGKLGLDSAALWLLPRLLHEDTQRVRGHVYFLLLTAALGGALSTAVVVALLPLAVSSGDQPELVKTVQAVSWLIPAGVLVLVVMAIVRALGAIAPFVVYGNVALPSLRLVSVAIAAGAGASALVVSFTWAVALLPILVLLLLVVRSQVTQAEFTVAHARPFEKRHWPSRADRRKVLGFALPRTASAGLEQLLVWLHILIVGAMLGPAAAGIYGAANRFIAAGLIVDTALRIVVSPRFSVLLHRPDVQSAQSLYRTATRWLVLFATPGFILLGTFAPVILGWLGPGFKEGAMALVLLSVGAMVTFLAGNTHSVLLMSGHATWAAFNKVVAVAVSVTGCLLLVPIYGMAGAASAWAAAVLLDASLAAVEVYLLIGVRPELPAALGSLVLSGMTVGVPALIARLALGQTNEALLAGTLAGAVLFIGSVIMLRRPLQLTGLRGDT